MEIKNQNTRTNSFYLYEETEKESFRFFADIFENRIDNIKTICDIGCAAGDLIKYIRKRFSKNNISIHGIDINSEMVDECREKYKDCSFEVGDIYTGISSDLKYDCVLFFGTLYLFSDFKIVFSNLLDLVKPNGVIYVFSPFNKYGYNVKYEYKYTQNGNSDISDIEYIYSIEAISKWIKDLGYKFKWYEFTIKKEIPRNEKDYPVRAWTQGINGELIIRDAICRIQEQFLLEIAL